MEGAGPKIWVACKGDNISKAQLSAICLYQLQTLQIQVGRIGQCAPIDYKSCIGEWDKSAGSDQGLRHDSGDRHGPGNPRSSDPNDDTESTLWRRMLGNERKGWRGQYTGEERRGRFRWRWHWDQWWRLRSGELRWYEVVILVLHGHCEVYSLKGGIYNVG